MSSVNMTRNKTILISILIFCLFVFLRFSNIYSVPVFVDEAIYVRWSQIMKAEASLRFLPMSDGKQPLFMWMTMPMFKLISDPLVAARTLSSLAGLGSMIGLSYLSYLFFKSLHASLLTGLVYSVLPFTVFFDRMALADSLLAMFGVWTLVFFKIFLEKRRLDFAMLTGFSLGAALLTKSPAIFYYLWIILATIFFVDLKNENKKTLFNLVLGFFYIFVISQAMHGILRLGPNSNMAGSRNLDYLYTFKEVFGHPTVPLIYNLQNTWSWLWYLVTPTILFSAIYAFFDKKNLKNNLLLLSIFLVPILSQALIAKVYTSRYILFAIIPLIPLAAIGLSKLKSWIIALLILLPLIFSVWNIYSPKNAPLTFDMANGYYQEWTAGWGQKEIADYLVDLHNQGKKIVVFTEGFFGTLPDGIQIYTQQYPNITVVGSAPIAETLPEGLLKTDPINERFFVINQSRNKLPSDELSKLELISVFPKHPRPEGTHESLQFFRLK